MEPLVKHVLVAFKVSARRSCLVDTNLKPAAGGCTYTVAAGDTLSALASKYGTTTAALQQSNQIANPNLITVGQVLAVPCSTAGSA